MAIQIHNPKKNKSIKTHRARAKYAGYELYSNPKWRRLRRWHLRRYPYCVDPFRLHGAEGEVATEVDHIEPWVNDHSLALKPSNLQSLCKSCHSKKTNKDQVGRAPRGYGFL